MLDKTVPAGIALKAHNIPIPEGQKPDAHSVPIPQSQKPNALNVTIPQAEKANAENIDIPAPEAGVRHGAEGLSESEGLQLARTLMGGNIATRTTPNDNIHVDSQRVPIPQSQKPSTQRVPIPEGQKPDIHRDFDSIPHGEKAAVEDLSALPDEDKQRIYESLMGRTMKPTVHRDTIQKKLNVGTTRYDFSRKSQNSSPLNENPDSPSPAYNGYIGKLNVGIGDNSRSSNMFLDSQDGRHYVGFTDDNGNFAAVYDLQDDSFAINPDFAHAGWVRRVEDDFRREFGNNPVPELLRRNFKEKAINAGQNEQVAEAASRVYMAANNFFAHYSKRSLLDTVMDDNLSIQYTNEEAGGRRGLTHFIAQ